MEESVRSSSGIVKKKSSSGCLIIKKKGDVSGSGSGGGSLKRARVPVSDPGSSDDSAEYANRKMREHCRNSPPLVYARRSEEERLRRNGEFVSGESKRSRLGLYDFDEYDEFDEIRTRNDYGEMGSGRNVKHSYYNSPPNGGARGRSKGIDDSGANLPASMMKMKYQHGSAEPIRLQGKNGVLKVMVNKKTKLDSSSSKGYGRQEFESRKGSVSEGPFYSESKRGGDVDRERSQMKSRKNKSKKAGGLGLEKNEVKYSKSPVNSKDENDEDSDWADTTLKLAPPSLEAGGSSRKGVKQEAKKSFTPENANLAKVREKKAVSPEENATPVKGVEGKLKQRGGSTEKQRLREQIRDMLMKAGWTIDYRPRRNRDYLDAVYINPNGTAYWSIIKAYDALQKQSQEDNEARQVGFAPLSDDLINKLTRQTRKKMEDEIKRKRKAVGAMKNPKKASVKGAKDDTDSDENDVRLSSFVKQNGKRGRFLEPKSEGGDDSSDDSCRQNSGQERAMRLSATTSSVVHGRKSRKIGRCTLLIRGSEKGRNAEPDGYVAYTGKRTLLAWLIDSGTVQSSQKVQYMNRRRNRVKLEGWITKDGIHCGCCSKILTVSKFELHAGSKLRQPFQNILLESGASLMQCLVDAWNKQPESTRRDFYEVAVDGDDPDDDTCGRCGDGGDLICCDGCPSTFHLNCLGMEVLPPGDWHCPNCICKFCGTTSGIPTSEINGTSSELSWCNLCERKYHKSCTDGMDSPNANANASNPSVDCCGKKCQESYDHLQKILGVKHELDSGFSWSLLQRTDLELDTAAKGFPQRVESNSKLAVALSVMDECFLPINDRRSGVNLIHNALYNCGSNFRRLDFRGFFTMVLERGDELIAAACIRIRGPQLAEMPFIGTRGIYRRQGMCRRLFSAIESVLCSLKIEKLIIPAVSEHLHTWTVIFGFKELKDSDKKSIMKLTNILVFPGTDLLQKQLLKQETPDAMTGFDSSDNLPQSPASVEKGDSESPSKPDTKTADCVESECNNKDEVTCDAPSSVASNSILGDVESRDLVSGTANGDADRDTMEDKKDEDANFLETPKPHAPAEVVLDDVILKDSLNNGIVEDRPNSSQTTVSANVVEDVQIEQIFDGKGSVESIETPGDDQVRNDLRLDSVSPNIGISEVSNVHNGAGTEGCPENGAVEVTELEASCKETAENGPPLDTSYLRLDSVADVSPMEVEEPHSRQENIEADVPPENLVEVSETTQTEGTKSGSVADVSLMDVEEPHPISNSFQEIVEADLPPENLPEVTENTQTEGTELDSVADVYLLDVEEPHSVSNPSCQEIVEADLPPENLPEVTENTEIEGTESDSVADVYLMDVEEPHSVSKSSCQEILEADLPPENLLEVSENTQTEGTTKSDEGETELAHNSSAALKPSVVEPEE